MIPLPKRYEVKPAMIDLRNTVETALKELIGVFLQSFTPAHDKKLVYEVQNPDGQTVLLRFMMGEDVQKMRKFGQGPNRTMADVILTGLETISQIKRMVVEAIQKTIAFTKRAANLELRRKKAGFDSNYVRLDRGCLSHSVRFGRCC